MNNDQESDDYKSQLRKLVKAGDKQINDNDKEMLSNASIFAEKFKNKEKERGYKTREDYEDWYGKGSPIDEKEWVNYKINLLLNNVDAAVGALMEISSEYQRINSKLDKIEKSQSNINELIKIVLILFLLFTTIAYSLLSK